MPVRLSISASTVTSSVSIAYGTNTTISASTMTAQIVDGSGNIVTADNTSVITFSQQGNGSLVFSISSATVTSGQVTATYRGSAASSVEILAKSTNQASAAATIDVVGTNALRVRYGAPSVGGGAGVQLLQPTARYRDDTFYRIILWTVNTTDRGRGDIAAVIHDAKSIGVSTYLNDAGEMFFTLPYNHPQITACVPLERHYRIDRFDEESGKYRAIGQGLLEDYEANINEVVFYGIDYMNVLNKTITQPTTTAAVTYSNQTFAQIYQNEMTQAVSQTNSRLGFIDFNAGTAWTHQSNFPLVINSSATTHTVFTAGEPRMGFLSNLANIQMSGTTQKVVFYNPLESENDDYNTFACDMNFSPTVNNDIFLEFGVNVRGFSYSPNFRRLRTRSLLIATNSGGTVSNIWSSIATSSTVPTSQYGVIDEVSTAEDIVNQTAVDARAQYNLYQSSPSKIKSINISVKDGVITPFKHYKLGDDIKVRIQRGIVDINENLTLTGQRYVANIDGSEQLLFEFFSKDAFEFNIRGSAERGSLRDDLVDNKLIIPEEKQRQDNKGKKQQASSSQETAAPAKGKKTKKKKK